MNNLTPHVIKCPNEFFLEYVLFFEVSIDINTALVLIKIYNSQFPKLNEKHIIRIAIQKIKSFVFLTFIGFVFFAN